MPKAKDKAKARAAKPKPKKAPSKKRAKPKKKREHAYSGLREALIHGAGAVASHYTGLPHRATSDIARNVAGRFI